MSHWPQPPWAVSRTSLWFPPWTEPEPVTPPPSAEAPPALWYEPENTNINIIIERVMSHRVSSSCHFLIPFQLSSPTTSFTSSPWETFFCPPTTQSSSLPSHLLAAVWSPPRSDSYLRGVLWAPSHTEPSPQEPAREENRGGREEERKRGREED